MGVAAMTGAVAAGLTGGLGLASSVGSGIANSKAQQKANETNLQIARENNEFNERMMEKQMEYNTQMYEKSLQDSRETWQQQFKETNAYNTPAAQRQRLQEAGYNPLLMTQNVGTVSGSSATSTSGSVQGVNPASAQPVQVQPARFDFSTAAGSIAAGLELYMGYQKNQAEVQQLNIENKFRALRIMRELAESFSRQKNNEAKTKTLDSMRDMEVQLQLANYGNILQQTENLKAVHRGLVIQNVMDSLTLKKWPELLNQRIAENAARIISLLASGAASRAQAQRDLAQKIVLEAQAEGIKINNFIAFQTAGDVIENAWNTTEMLRKDLDNYISPRERGLWNLGSAAAAGVGAAVAGRSGIKRPRSSTTRSYSPQRGWSGSQTIYEY